MSTPKIVAFKTPYTAGLMRFYQKKMIYVNAGLTYIIFKIGNYLIT